MVATQMGLHLSSSQLSLSLVRAFVRPVSPLPCSSFLPLQGLGCPITSLQLLMLGAPSMGPWCPKMLELLEPRTFLAHVSVCCSQGKRMEAVQDSSTMQCRVAVSCQPSTGELHIHVSRLQTLQAGQDKSQRTRQESSVHSALPPPTREGQGARKREEPSACLPFYIFPPKISLVGESKSQPIPGQHIP